MSTLFTKLLLHSKYNIKKRLLNHVKPPKKYNSEIQIHHKGQPPNPKIKVLLNLSFDGNRVCHFLIKIKIPVRAVYQQKGTALMHLRSRQSFTLT